MSEQHEINMDRSMRVIVDTKTMAWEGSPAEGVTRKPLEREAAESGRVTSIVQFEPGSSFREHTHPQGEEILVLEGVFEDENGFYPAGSYLRHPPQSKHAPLCSLGCQLLVKLDMFAEGDTMSVNMDTGAQNWVASGTAGIEVINLHAFKQEATQLLRMSPESVFELDECAGFEFYVLQGAVECHAHHCDEQVWFRSSNAQQSGVLTSASGCILWLKFGHLGVSD